MTLPALGESVTEGTVTRWLKKVGDSVQADEGLLEISTDKVDTEIPSPVSGVIEEILVQEDETVEIGAVLAKIGDGSSAPAESEPAESAPAESAPEQSAPEQSAPAADGASGRDLDRALQQLSGEQREVVLLVGLEGLTYAETAEVLDIPVGTVMSRLARGRGRLRTLMDYEGGDKGGDTGGRAALRRVK